MEARTPQGPAPREGLGAPTAELEREEPSGRDGFDSWPRKGGDADRQPWAAEEDRRPQVAHSKPILTSGSAGPEVLELAQRLDVLGYETTISKGENPMAVLDPSVSSAVAQFRQDYGVREDPEPFGGATEEGQRAAANHVGPWTWEAVIRASEREAD